jgi:hypothetical protein
MNSIHFKGEAALSYRHEENHSRMGFTNPPISLVTGGLYSRQLCEYQFE